MSTGHNQHELPPRYGVGEGFDWTNPNALKSKIELHLFSLGVEEGLQGSSELAEILTELLPGDDYLYLGLDVLRVYCEELAKIAKDESLRQAAIHFVNIIRVFDAGILVAQQPDLNKLR
jgi:hypothetical protein